MLMIRRVSKALFLIKYIVHKDLHKMNIVMKRDLMKNFYRQLIPRAMVYSYSYRCLQIPALFLCFVKFVFFLRKIQKPSAFQNF